MAKDDVPCRTPEGVKGEPEQPYYLKVANEAEQFYIRARELHRIQEPVTQSGMPEAMDVPFANSPFKYYVRDSHVMSVPEPNLHELTKKLQTITVYDHRCYPVFDALRYLGEKALPARYVKEEFLPKGDCGNEASGRLLSIRIATVQYQIDVAELTPRKLAVMLSSSMELARELERKEQIALETYKKQRGHSPAKTFLKRGPVQVHVKLEAFILEVFSYVTVAGNLI